MSKIILRIDTKYYRFNVHRNALHEIEDPPFLKFAFEPESMLLMVEGSWKRDSESIRVRFDASGSVNVYSKALITGIREVTGLLTETGSYRVEGEPQKSYKRIMFQLRTAKRIVEEAPL